MARRLFFVDQVRSGHAEITGESARHLTRVLRVEAGHKYEISDNVSLYLAEVEKARKEQVVFRVLERLEARDPGPAITLCAALVKFDHFEWMIEKATELGVSRILPVAAARSEKGLDQGARKRLERWRRIALESSQQCRRAHLPQILDPAAFGAALQTEASLRLFLDETGGGGPILKALSPAPSAAVLVGPEGGWTEAERGDALNAGWKAVSLGSNILRAETAALAALAVMGCSLRG